MPRTKEDYKEIIEERLDSIHKAALPLFAIKGYDSVTVDDITNKAKCSHGLFYHYYKNKQELFFAIMHNITEKWNEYIDQINFDQKPIDVLRDINDFYFKFLNGSDEDAYILYLFLTLHVQKKLPVPNLLFCTNTKRKKPYQELTDLFELGQKEGVFYSCKIEDLNKMYYASLFGLAYNRIFLGKKRFKAPEAELLINMLLSKGGNIE